MEHSPPRKLIKTTESMAVEDPSDAIKDINLILGYVCQIFGH